MIKDIITELFEKGKLGTNPIFIKGNTNEGIYVQFNNEMNLQVEASMKDGRLHGYFKQYSEGELLYNWIFEKGQVIKSSIK